MTGDLSTELTQEQYLNSMHLSSIANLTKPNRPSTSSYMVVCSGY